ncbi:BamA/TamA family outer membrane protein [Alkalimonas collagenimarina]|uniref:BamA/TamA family outer membrane protein n=1 Tax=Alkalimonas collagenimarina TaxID=400390 RepID=A0ABT9GVZ1_9GAMM|nr:BamA/TamA family outer membrane protein [Alkalimonas collagenimarina]MDP4535219.1 BamA/TamA family outer membrane protein [Alkalimonas collagenimarina]
MRWLTGLLVFSCCAPWWVTAECIAIEEGAPPETNQALTIRHIHFETNNVFDLSEPGTFWLHRFANATHSITRESTLSQDLLFSEGSLLNEAELAETGRLLRSRGYLREADVYVSHYCANSQQVDVTVRSFDNWSLLPKIDFKHEGGSTEYSLGIAEDNLLGSGNQIQLDYTKDSERTGYLFSFASPNMFGSYWSSRLQYADNSDGESYTIALDRPFYRLNSPWAMGLELNKGKDELREYQSGEESNRYDRRQQWLQNYIGFNLKTTEFSAQRLIAGFRLSEVKFESNDATLTGVPEDRDLSALWLEYQWIQSDFQKLYQINQFNRTEDINFGWQLVLQVERFSDWLGADENGWQFRAELLKNWTLWDGGWLLSEHSLQQQQLSNQTNRSQFSTHWLLIHHLTPQSSLVGRLQLDIGRNLYRDELLQLGGDNGMRAYPLYYQRGEKQWLASAEYRHYTPWSILRLFDVAFASFVDVGRAWNDPWTTEQASETTLFGVGGGVRLLSKYSSRGTMVHLDIATPLRREDGLDSWQFRATAKRRF